jgi:hypothetical protein
MAETLTRHPFQDFCAAYGCVWKKTAKFRLSMNGSDVFARVDFAPNETGEDAMTLRVPEQPGQRAEDVELTARPLATGEWMIGVVIDANVYGLAGTWPDIARVLDMKSP